MTNSQSSAPVRSNAMFWTATGAVAALGLAALACGLVAAFGLCPCPACKENCPLTRRKGS
ncbi:MAG: hypothetical protein JSR45_18230 [Proteobacteria bacterium]|nr:hypothetical protein [Pseudomonadota bacterium]